MPLPAALQARLAKRGIIKTGEQNESEHVEPSGKCPNRSNPFHKCVEYCRTRWGVDDENDQNKVNNYENMPLPPGWFLVPDPSTGATYFWNTVTNQVSWLHPLNPKADITMPASQNGVHDVIPNHVIPSPLIPSSDEKEQMLNVGKHPSLIRGTQKKTQAAVKRKQAQDSNRKKVNKSDELDPLDPASYSDVPRGTWSTGLVEKGEAKTGVDTTANGPLFQQRPYPSPGEVLRRNAANK